MPNLEPERTDERLEAVLRSVKRGTFPESPWRLFKESYFRSFTEEEAREELTAWGKRHGVEVSWRDGKTTIVGQTFDVEWLNLRLM